MGKRGRTLIVIAAVAVLAVLARTVFHTPSSAPEPVYNGKPLSYWLRQALGSAQNPNSPSLAEANTAINKIGTDAIPILLQMLRAKYSRLDNELLSEASQYHFLGIHYVHPGVLSTEAMLGFDALDPHAAAPAVPELIEILDQNYSSWSRSSTAQILGRMGPDARAAVPALLRAATSTNEMVYGCVLGALGQIHADPDSVVPVLTKALQNPSGMVRVNAVTGLGRFHGDAKSAVPALVEMLNDPKLNSSGLPISLRAIVQHALQQIDPETYARVVTNTEPVSTH